MTQDRSSLDPWITEESSDADEEHRYVRELRSEIDADTEAVRRLVDRLPETAPFARRRIVRALDGWIPRDSQSFSDFEVSSDPVYLYYLVRSLKQPLRTDVFEDLKPLVDRDSTALAGAAASALTLSYDQEREFIVSLLGENRRNPVRIEVLKKLYNRGIDAFTDELLRIYDAISSPSVRFYLAVLLVATARETDFDGALPEDEMIESVGEGIDVSGFGAGVTQN